MEHETNNKKWIRTMKAFRLISRNFVINSCVAHFYLCGESVETCSTRVFFLPILSSARLGPKLLFAVSRLVERQFVYSFRFDCSSGITSINGHCQMRETFKNVRQLFGNHLIVFVAFHEEDWMWKCSEKRPTEKYHLYFEIKVIH